MLEPEYRIQEHIIDSAFYFRTALDGEETEGDPKSERIPVKKFLGPVSPFNFYTRVSPEHRSCLNGIMKKYGPLMEACDFITYWTDGKNTIGEITEYMGYETGIRNPEFVSEYLDLLEKTGLIEFKESRD